MASEIAGLIAKVAELERRIANQTRHGTVHEVKKGRVRIKWGDKEDGSPFLSPWIRTSSQNGFASEHVPYVVGQTVTSVSMDPDHRSATVMPYSDSDNNPLDGEAADDAHTYRIRKPPEGGGQNGEPPKRKDDAEDFKIKRTYDGFEVTVGSGASFAVKRDGITMKVGGQEVTFNAEGFKMKVASFTGEQS